MTDQSFAMYNDSTLYSVNFSITKDISHYVYFIWRKVEL